VRQARPDHRHDHDEEAQDAEPEQSRAQARRLGDDPEALHGQPHSRSSRKRLVIYLMSGPETPELAEAAVAAGADLVELGFPFSDPLADGPVIRRAGERALARGMRTKQCLEVLARTRELVGDGTPLIPMTYSSLFEAHGWDVLTREIHEHGGTSMIVADLPAGERGDLRRVQMVAPTSTDERIELAGRQTDGWLYLVTLTGTTGARDDVSPALAGLVERTRKLVDVPLYAGFGISTPDHARAAAALADGIAVGSRAVQVAEEGPAALREYVASLRAAL
jgi:tryptophan synthase alpha chain